MRALSNSCSSELASGVHHIHGIDGYLFMGGSDQGFEVRGVPALGRVGKKRSIQMKTSVMYLLVIILQKSN